MSRDWTPQEMYNVDKMLTETQGRTLRDQTIYFIKPDGSRIPMESKQNLKIRKQYKELGFLFSLLPHTYKLLDKHPKYRNRVLNQIEKHLQELVITNNGDEQDTVWLWYTGNLDKNFYYREYNNELFQEYIINEVNKLVNN